jgi:hypothetical protein
MPGLLISKSGIFMPRITVRAANNRFPLPALIVIFAAHEGKNIKEGQGQYYYPRL